jgi:hypothetical protein
LPQFGRIAMRAPHDDFRQAARLGFQRGQITDAAFIHPPAIIDPGDKTALLVARFRDLEVQASDMIFADDDGCVFVAAASVEDLLTTARTIWQRERQQAEAIKSGAVAGTDTATERRGYSLWQPATGVAETN